MLSWVLTLLLTVLAIYGVWLIFTNFSGWEKKESAAPQLDEPESHIDAKDAIQDVKSNMNVDSSSSWRSFFWQKRWLLGLIAVGTLILFYAALFGPPRLTGKIPISPLQPGRPFYNLRWLRNFLNDHYQSLSWIIAVSGSSVSLIVLVFAQIRRKRLMAKIGLLLIALTIAGEGQWMLGNEMVIGGLALYGLAALVLVSWAWLGRDRIKGDLSIDIPASPYLELAVILGIIGLAAFTRLYTIANVPYGIEGDESKWIYEVVRLMVDGYPDSSGEYHRDALPLSFFMQMPFQRLLGLGILSARVGVAIYSILGTLVFYWLVRQIAPFPLACLATLFLSISLMDVSASRLANVESHVKLWPILTLALLAWGGSKDRWEIYALSGITLAFGLLTYDTVWPLALIATLLALVDFYDQKVAIKTATLQMAAFIFPTLLSLPLLVPYAVSRFSYYKIDEKGWNADFWITLRNHFFDVLQTWFVDSRFDFIYNRKGPLLNSILLPLLVLGAIIAILHLRHRISLWMMIWMSLIVFPIPVISAVPLGRVYYPALPAIYGLIALGGYILAREIIRLLGPNLIPLGVVTGFSVLVWLFLFNMFIYFNEVGDPKDRQIRRELGEMAIFDREANSMLYLPYFPGANDPLFVETQILELYLRQQVNADQLHEVYKTIPYDEFLPELAKNGGNWDQVIVMVDKKSPSQRELRDLITNTLYRCFPGGELWQGEYIDRYTLDPSISNNPACIPSRLTISPQNKDADTPFPTITWSLSNGTASSLTLVCNQGREDVIRIEAEDLTKGAGWKEDIAFVDGWTGRGYLADNYGSQDSSSMLDLFESQQVYGWIRYYKRQEDDFPAYMNVGDHSYPFADVSSNQLNYWIWEQIGPFGLDKGVNRYTISRPYDGQPEKFMALFIDAVIFTTDPGYSPEQGTTWYSTVKVEHKLTKDYNQGDIVLELDPGQYSCRILVKSDLPLVDAYGKSPIQSNTIEINLLH